MTDSPPLANAADSARRRFSGPDLLQIAMPMGGIGAGCICLNGIGGLQDFSIRHHPSTTAHPDNSPGDAAFGILHIKGEQPVTKLLEGPMPVEKIYNTGLNGLGFRQAGHEGLPRFSNCSFEAGYPFGRVSLSDANVPLDVTLTGWSPFIPLDDVNSGLPCAILEYSFHNSSSAPVEFEFSFHLSHLPLIGTQAEKKSRNAVIGPSQENTGGGVHFYNTFNPHDERYASAAVYAIGHQPLIKAMWFRGGWFDSVSALWREVSEGRFKANAGNTTEDRDGTNGGSLLLPATLAPGESITYPIVLTWYYPNSNQRQGGSKPVSPGEIPLVAGNDSAPAWQPFYATKWHDAGEVARYVADHYQSLRDRTQRFTDALFASTLPGYVVDAVASNLAILKSPTVLRQGNGQLWGWEGSTPLQGCCAGSCTHVWNYAQAFPHLFPNLERGLREQELACSMDARGHINFRAALCDTAGHDYHAASDGQLGGILKLYRDYHISGDRAWLEQMYPLAKKSLDFCIESWDPEHKGGLFEPHHNTYDIEFWGPDGMCGSVYVGALCALASLAGELGRAEEANSYSELARRAAAFMDSTLFNGDYYQQNVQWEGLRDTSFTEKIANVTDSSDETLQLLQSEGPKYQYGAGCLSDGIIGAWMARIYGVETALDKNHIRSTLQFIFKNNFKPDLWDHANPQRPGYALGHEAGLLLCTWPRGGKPTLPFVYSDEIWTGIEYQVASHLIEEGFVSEGLTLVQAVRARYEGHVRNPFNEYECGSYYARALASFALLNSLSGFRYDAARHALYFGPRISNEDFSCFFSTASGFGTISLHQNRLSLKIIEGQLQVESVHFARHDRTRVLPWNITAIAGHGAELTIT